jgi:hypothetical protein
MTELGPLTTASIYTADLQWIKGRQLKFSGEQGTWVPMPDMIHALVGAVQQAEEAGA